MTKNGRRWTACILAALLLAFFLASCSLLRLSGGEGTEGSGTESAAETEDTGTEENGTGDAGTDGRETEDLSMVLESLQGEWFDINSKTILSFRGDEMTVRFGSWSETYKIVLEDTGYALRIRGADGDLGEMSDIAVNEDGSLSAYERVLDGPSRDYRFVREDAVAGEKELTDLSTDMPKTIESREIREFILDFANTGTYGLDSGWAEGRYYWKIEKNDDGTYYMEFEILGDSYVIMDFAEIVDEEYVKGLADLIAEKNVAENNGYHWKNNVQAEAIYLYVKYESKEKIVIHAEGDAAKTCPFDLPALLEYAYGKTGQKGWE